MHLRPLTDGRGSQGGTRATEGRALVDEALLSVGRRIDEEACWDKSAGREAGMPYFTAGAGERESESLVACGVALVES